MELTPCSVTQPHRWTSFLSDTATHSLIQKQDRIFIKLHVQGSAMIDHSDGYNRTTKCCASKAACPNLAVPDPVSPQNHLHAAQCGAACWEGSVYQSGSKSGLRVEWSKTEDCLAAPASGTTATDEDAIMWLKLFIHFPLPLHFFISKAFCPLLPFYTA